MAKRAVPEQPREQAEGALGISTSPSVAPTRSGLVPPAKHRPGKWPLLPRGADIGLTPSQPSQTPTHLPGRFHLTAPHSFKAALPSSPRGDFK